MIYAFKFANNELMKPILHILTALAVLLPATLVAQSAGKTDAAAAYWQVYEQFLDMAPDPAQKAEVENLTLQRDVGRFLLEKGTLYLCTPVNGRVYAAIFRGRGTFSFTPPTEVEKAQLARFYKTPALTKAFKTLFLIFADSTLAELRGQLDFSPGHPGPEFDDAVHYALRYLSRKRGKQFDFALLKIALNELHNDFFHAHFSWQKTTPFFWEINPFEEEEVRFMRRLRGPSYLYIAEVINQFQLQRDREVNGQGRAEQKSHLEVDQYTLDVTLTGSQLRFSARAAVHFTALAAQQQWISFRLFNNLEVDSAFWEDHRPAVFVKEKDNPYLWLHCDPPLAAGQTRRVVLHYHGKLIERQGDWFYLLSSRTWYPKNGNRHRANFDITYRYPKNFQFSSSGVRVSQDTVGNQIISRWVSARPAHNMSFNIGFFKEYEIITGSMPPITVQMAETGHQEIARRLGTMGIGSGRQMEKQVGKDVLNSIRFFQEVYDTLTVPHFFATDIPFRHGEAFPGLIHLSWRTFQRTREDGSDEVFRAHEVAHQWWGIGVDFETYHDQWISEAFAEYSGWWYLQSQRLMEENDDQKFYDLLAERRKEIVGNRKYIFGRGKKAGPIWMGYRTLSADTQGDYRLIIYQKGAWVLHMLRMMLLDLDTGSEETFRQIMKGFYRKYKGQKVTTAHFRDFAVAVSGQDLDWFFQQWVYGTDIPTYQFAYQILPQPDGTYQVLGWIGQKEVSTHFRMPVLIGVDFGNEQIRPVRVWVAGESTRFELGPFAERPHKLIFNYRESVLGEVEFRKWQDWMSGEFFPGGETGSNF